MKALVLGLLRAYKRWLSPLLPPACRFEPTCSEYMAEAVARYGAWRGVGMGLRRLARCQPMFPGGYDPVPDLPGGSLPERTAGTLRAPGDGPEAADDVPRRPED